MLEDTVLGLLGDILSKGEFADLGTEDDDSRLLYEARKLQRERQERGPKSSQPNSSTIEISQIQVPEPGSTPYQPLDCTKKSIRLLYLIPGNQNCEIRCTTKNFITTECPHYAAVSYTWGDPSVTRQIWLNDKPFWVRQNLWDLLHQFRNDKTALILWIDAICIDQDNVRERNHQVDLMSSIYKNAERVLVWLGAAKDDSDFAIACLKWIQQEPTCSCRGKERVWEDRYWMRESGSYSWNRPQRHECNIAWQHAMVLQKRMWSADVQERWEIAIVKLLEREYWQRAWIIQEILLATHIDVCCGEHVVLWNTFQSFILKQKPQPLRERMNRDGGETVIAKDTEVEILPNVSHLSSLIMKSAAFGLCSQRQPRQQLRESSGVYDVYEFHSYPRDPDIRQDFKLAELIQRNVHAQCTDPRDKVYAFLGLATDCAHGAGIRADYSKSPVQLYIDVVYFYDASETGLDFILTVRDMLRVTSVEVDHFVRNKGSPSLPRSIIHQEMVNLTAAHMGIISEVFPNWFANNQKRVSETRRFLKLTVGDLSPSTIDDIFNLGGLRAFLPEFSNMNPVVTGSDSQPVLILTGRRATHRVGFGCAATRTGDLVCQFVNSESAIIVRKVNETYTIVGKATMMKQGLPEETPIHPLTGEAFTFSAISQDGLEKTTQLTWRLHPLDLVGREVSNHQGLGLSMIRPPRPSADLFFHNY